MILVLLPGMDGTGTLFEPFIAALGPHFSVTVVHYPTDMPMSYAELETVARAALPAEGPFIILGESFSGPIAVSIAASCSSHLKGLVLCCSFVSNPHPCLSSLKPLVGLLPVMFAPKAALNHFLLGPFATDPLRKILSRAIAQVTPATFRARLKAVFSVDVSAKFTALTVPVLYLRASHDRVVPHAASELVALINPRARTAQIEAPHCLLQVAPEEAAQVIGNFVLEVQKNIL